VTDLWTSECGGLYAGPESSHHRRLMDLPSGTVTFLFTDVEGSTRLLQELGDGYANVLAEHRRVLRDVFARHTGVEVDTQGDAFFVAFSRASNALAAARDLQLTRVDLDEFAWYCPKCWAREFGDQSESDRRRFS
jgi:class 3 adenylate cyclase